MAEKVVLFVLFIPVFVTLLWGFFDPKESLLFGKRWMYEGEPEPSKEAIGYTRFFSAICTIILAVLFILFLRR